MMHADESDALIVKCDKMQVGRECRWKVTDVVGEEDGLGIECLSGSGAIARSGLGCHPVPCGPCSMIITCLAEKRLCGTVLMCISCLSACNPLYVMAVSKYSFTHSLVQSFVHLFVVSLVRLFARSFVRSFVCPLIHFVTVSTRDHSDWYDCSSSHTLLPDLLMLKEQCMQCVCSSIPRGLHSDSGEWQNSGHWSLLGAPRSQVSPPINLYPEHIAVSVH